MLNTKAVQKVVDECSENGGGIVRFEKGVYVLSTVFLKSNVTIEISNGTEYYNDQRERADIRTYRQTYARTCGERNRQDKKRNA